MVITRFSRLCVELEAKVGRALGDVLKVLGVLGLGWEARRDAQGSLG